MELRAPYNYDADAASLAAGLDTTGEPTKTQQQFKDDADINTIVRRFGITGQLPNGIGIPRSGDFTNITDFQTAMNTVIAAQDAFMLLPGETRARFNNNPQQLLAFLDDPANRDEAIKLGIIEKPPAPVPPSDTVDTTAPK